VAVAAIVDQQGRRAERGTSVGLGSWPPFDGAGMSAWAAEPMRCSRCPTRGCGLPARVGSLPRLPVVRPQDMANRMAADIVDDLVVFVPLVAARVGR
jgi:hypothetical protein